jgi:hypothetical protein
MKFLVLASAALLLVACDSSRSGGLRPNQTTLIADDLPIDYASAQEALQQLPARPGLEAKREISPGVTQYSSGVSELTTWYAFGKGSYAYPAVVRNRVVGTPRNFVVKTAILCGAEPAVCAKVKEQFAHSYQR